MSKLTVHNDFSNILFKDSFIDLIELDYIFKISKNETIVFLEYRGYTLVYMGTYIFYNKLKNTFIRQHEQTENLFLNLDYTPYKEPEIFICDKSSVLVKRGIKKIYSDPLLNFKSVCPEIKIKESVNKF